jgi:hypothetical protein
MSDTMDAKLKRTRRTASVDLDALYQIIMLKCGFHDSALRPRDASTDAASDVGALAQQFETNRKDYPADAELIFYLLHDHISGEQKAPQKKLRAVFQKVLMRFCGLDEKGKKLSIRPGVYFHATGKEVPLLTECWNTVPKKDGKGKEHDQLSLYRAYDTCIQGGEAWQWLVPDENGLTYRGSSVPLSIHLTAPWDIPTAQFGRVMKSGKSMYVVAHHPLLCELNGFTPCHACYRPTHMAIASRWTNTSPSPQR